MFREMRRKKNEISIDMAKQLLESSRRGVLAVNGDDGYPYAIPINYIYDEEAQKIYFHGAKAGHKIDALRACDKVCFTVYGNETVRTESWAPFMQSVVVFGRCHLMDAGSEAIQRLKQFAMKYYPSKHSIWISTNAFWGDPQTPRPRKCYNFLKSVHLPLTGW